MCQRLTRSREDRVLTGVAAGLARHLGVDPFVVRAAFVALTLAWGIGLVLYLVAALIIPGETEEPMEQVPPGRSEAPAPCASPAALEVTPAPSETETQVPEPGIAPVATAAGGRPDTGQRDAGGSRRRNTVAIILIVIGVIFLLENYLELLAWDRLWPVTLIVIGLLLLLQRRR